MSVPGNIRGVVVDVDGVLRDVPRDARREPLPAGFDEIIITARAAP